MTEQMHTPGPWKVAEPNREDGALIVKAWEFSPSFGSNGERHNRIPGPMLMADYRGGHIATVGVQANTEALATARANAAFIVRACNSHQALVDLAEMVEHAADNGGHPINGKDVGALLKAARAALALAKKGA
jgi:hypothetical protein